MYKAIFKSTLPLFLTVVLSLIVGIYGIGRVKALGTQIAQAQKDKNVLTDKLNVLRNIDSTIETGSQTSSVALPDKNSAFIVLSQIRGIAQQNGVALSDLASGVAVKDPSGFSRVNISFAIVGSRAGIIAFLNGVQKIAPLTLVDKIEFAEAKKGPQATITVKSFWSPFPQSLPALNEQISSLTPDEEDTLSKVNALIQPQFAEVPATDTGGKADPFSP
jgi:hypothetical protein